MNIIDLTHTISPSMPVYPDTETPIFIQGCTIEKDGFLEKKITALTQESFARENFLATETILENMINYWQNPALDVVDFSKTRNKEI